MGGIRDCLVRQAARMLTTGILRASRIEDEGMKGSCCLDQAWPLSKDVPLTSGDCIPQVPLLLHQKQALAWLLWRESQKPQGGILGKCTTERSAIIPGMP